MSSPLTIALFFGGRSGEHEVSLRSAAAVSEALAARFQVIHVYVDRAGRWWLRDAVLSASGTEVYLLPHPEDHGTLHRVPDGRPLARPDVFFPLVHGTNGEDGTIQGLFELTAVPYVGSGVAASAAGMDKELMKALFAAAGLPQVSYRVLRARKDSLGSTLVAELGLPLFVKPANLGSSVGVTKVKRANDLRPALEWAFEYDRKVMVEAAVDARELEVSVLGNEAPEASLPGEIVPDREFYDYDSKYSTESRTELRIPAPIDDATTESARALALRTFRAIDACGYSRVDFFLERGSGKLLVNEINTIPGFTSISMFPKLWAASGLAYVDLVSRLVALALSRHAERAGLKTDPH